MDSYLQDQKYCKNNSCWIVILKIAWEVTTINLKKKHRRKEKKPKYTTYNSDNDDYPVYKRSNCFLNFLYFVL